MNYLLLNIIFKRFELIFKLALKKFVKKDN